MFRPGTNEIVVGKSLSDEFEHLNLGDTISFGPTKWVVVGIFQIHGSAFESEMGADVSVLHNLFHINFRSGVYA